MNTDPLSLIITQLRATNELKAGSILLSAFAKHSSSVDQFDTLGRLFHDIKDYPRAIECTENCLVLAQTPHQAYASRSNLAKLYNHTNQPDKALLYIKANLSINPNDYESKMEMLFSHYLMSNFEKSRNILETIINDPEAPEEVKSRCEFNLGSYLLDDGIFKEGLVKFIDVGHQIGIWPKTNLPIPVWDGKVIPGQTVLIFAEGGIGDEVINVRFAKNIKDLGMNPILVTNRKDTQALFSRNGFSVMSPSNRYPENSVGILSMYLPIVLNLDEHELWNVPYLKPDPKYVEKWSKILPQGKKVSLRWSGNPDYEQDLHRSLPLDELDKNLNFSRTDVTFISVQKENFECIIDYPSIFNAAPYLDTLEDLLACLSLMDYNITSCTSVAHIAAAAGLPVTVCPPIATYYTWLGDIKWYGDNCTILRQKKWKDWTHLQQLVV